MFAPISIAGLLLVSLWLVVVAGVVTESAHETWSSAEARSRITLASLLAVWLLAIVTGVWVRSAVPYWPRDPELVPVEAAAR